MNQSHQQVEPQKRAIVHKALNAFGISEVKWSVLADGSNLVVKLDTSNISSHGQLVLRILNPEVSEVAVASQLYWLGTFAQCNALRVPQPVALNGSATVTVTQTSGVDRQCMLLQWIDGMTIQQPTVEFFESAGEATAHLHALSNPVVLPSWFQCRIFDSHFLFGEQSCLHHPSALPLLGDIGRSLIQETQRQFEQVCTELGSLPEAYGLLHGDLHLNNLVIREGAAMGIIDFDGFGRGHHLFDLAEILRLVGDNKSFPEYRNALIVGYERVSGRPVRVEHLHVFIAVAFVNYLNWGFASGDAEFLRWISFALDRIRTYLP